MTEAQMERARVVAFLRKQAMAMATKIVGAPHAHDTLCRIQARLQAADAIERGEHIKEN